MKTRGLGWGAVLVVGVVMGGWLSKARVAAGGGGLLPLSTATLQISTTPEQPFKLAIARQTDGDGRTFDGAAPVQLEVGDWFVDVIPASQSFQRRRLKVHMTSGQVLMLPVELRTVSPPLASPPPGWSRRPSFWSSLRRHRRSSRRWRPCRAR